jgi:superfamily I DNA and RNA helicase
MNVIHGSIPREKAAVFTVFKQAIEGFDDEGTLFLAFPIVEVMGTSSAIDALLVSPIIGLVAIDLFPDAILDKASVMKRQDDLYVGLQSRFIKHEGLRIDRRTLSFDINILTFAPFVKDKPAAALEGAVYDKDEFLALIDTWRQAVPIETLVTKQIISVVQAVDKLRASRKPRPAAAVANRATVLSYIEGQIANLDRFQNKAIVETTDSPQRIRGLAGCGKTIVVASKAAYLHATNRDLDIVVTFYTRALYGHLRNLILRFFSAYTNSFDEPDWSKLRLMHAWGSTSSSGVYSEIAIKNGLQVYDYSGALQKFGIGGAFTGACDELQRSLTKPVEIFDIVIVDEAQDIPPSFFKALFASTRAPKRIIWAYDEMQKLDNEETMLPPEELFGTVEGVPNVSLKNEDGKPAQDIVLPVCYRNPKEILVTAHALGFGVYRPQGPIQMINDTDLWKDIGYDFLEGEDKPGSKVVLARRNEASPAFLSEHNAKFPIVNIQRFENPDAQAEWIAASIANNLKGDGLESTDIIVIHPDPITTKSAVKVLQTKLTEKGIPNHVAGVGYDRDQFFVNGSVVIGHIFRAKGNEAAVVYVMDSEDCADGNELIKKRNILFTAVTRARAWVYICGVGARMKALEQEILLVQKHRNQLEFVWPSPEEQQKLRNLHRELTPQEKQLRTRGKKSLDELTKLLMSGKLSIDELPAEEIEKLKRLLDGK